MSNESDDKIDEVNIISQETKEDKMKETFAKFTLILMGQIENYVDGKEENDEEKLLKQGEETFLEFDKKFGLIKKEIEDEDSDDIFLRELEEEEQEKNRENFKNFSKIMFSSDAFKNMIKSDDAKDFTNNILPGVEINDDFKQQIEKRSEEMIPRIIEVIDNI